MVKAEGESKETPTGKRRVPVRPEAASAKDTTKPKEEARETSSETTRRTRANREQRARCRAEKAVTRALKYQPWLKRSERNRKRR